MSAKLFSLKAFRETQNVEASEFIRIESTGWPLLDACLSRNRTFSEIALETLRSASVGTHGGTEDEPL